MELIKDLPDVFNDFAEQRRNSFLAVKEIKDQGIPVVGAYCGYFPKELAHAAGAVSVGLCSVSDETIPDAEEDLPKNLCPLIKSSYGFAKTKKCPYFYFSDLVIGETTCDGKKKMYEFMEDFKDVFVMQLPQNQSESSRDYWKSEIIRLKEYMEKKFDTEITDEKMRAAVHENNQVNEALKNFSAVMKHNPAPISGMDMYHVLYGSGFKFDRHALIDEINAMTEKVEKNYAAGQMEEKKPRILLTGCPVGGATEKVIRAIENNGAVMVVMENCTGIKPIDRPVDESAEDIYEAIADKYLNIGCSVMSPNPNRYELLGRLIDEYQVDGVVEMTLTACHTYNVETGRVRKFVNEEKHIPYMAVETDYSQSDEGQLNTRVAAFIEML